MEKGSLDFKNVLHLRKNVSFKNCLELFFNGFTVKSPFRTLIVRMTAFLSAAEHNIFWRMLVTKHLTIDFHCTDTETHTETFLKIFYFMFHRRNKKALERHEGEEMMTDVCFLLNCLFKLLDPAQN